MKTFRFASLFLVLSLILAACAPAATQAPTEPPAPEPSATPMPAPTAVPTEVPPQTIVDIAAADGRFTTLVAAVEAAGLVETLQGDGPFTVFAPTDDAFAKLPAGTVDALLADVPQLTNILLYHVVPGEYMAADVLAMPDAATALENQYVKFSLDGDKAMVNDALIVVTDVAASNGVIHVIDTVLLPPDKDIVETAAADGRFTTLVAALEAAGLVETLQGEGPFTVFAPTDDAFAMLPAGTVEALLADIPALTDILLYHVAGENLPASKVLEMESIPTVQGEDITISQDMEKVMANNAQIIISNVFTSNGTIHVIDAVLLPPQDIVEVAVANGSFTTLAAALEAAGLVETLQGEGPFTVFAPTDEAFAKLPAGTVEALLADIPALTDILLYHVVPGEYVAADVVEMTSAETALGPYVKIAVDGDKVMVNDAQVVITDVQASNGVIHVIDTVLLPPDKDIVETAVADGRFTTLAAALEAAGLVETLQGEGPFTVFAPTDDAFAKLPAGTVEGLLADIPALTDILLYHVAAENLSADKVLEMKSIPTVQGKNIEISQDMDKVMANEAQIIITDIFTSNGTIHVIDAVLLPPQ